jgi:2-dehydropantoate 2-reductase
MDVLIYGGGAVGLGLASCLVRPGRRVEIVARPDTVAALRDEGLLRTGIFGRVQAAPEAFRCGTSLDEVTGPYDLVLICTKSFDSAAAAQDLAGHEDRIGRRARLVLFQNGWGNAEAFAAHFKKQRIYSARVITAGKRTEIDALNGAVLQLAQQHGLAVPYNLAVYNLLRFLESARRD